MNLAADRAHALIELLQQEQPIVIHMTSPRHLQDLLDRCRLRDHALLIAAQNMLDLGPPGAGAPNLVVQICHVPWRWLKRLGLVVQAER
jgi:16S rRNA G527 N7-methylase RsmG